MDYFAPSKQPPVLDSLLGWQQAGPPDDWNTDDCPGDLWEVWSSFYHHP